MTRALRKCLLANPMAKRALLFAVMLALTASILSGLLLGLTGGARRQFVYLDSIPLSRDLQRYTFDLCQQYGIEYELVLAVMWKESGFRTDAVGHNTNGTRDSGVMQINDVNREWLRRDHGINDLMDPYQNIRAGVNILADYKQRFGDDRAVLLAYQMGEGGMRRLQARGITTNAQVESGLAKRDEYRLLLAGAGGEAKEERQTTVWLLSTAVLSGSSQDAAEDSEDRQVDTAGSEEPPQQDGEPAGATGNFFAATSEPRTVSPEEALAAYREALAGHESGVVTVTLRGAYDCLPLVAQRDLAEQAAADGVEVVLRISRADGRVTTSRITVNPEEATGDLLLVAGADGGAADRVAAYFRSWFANDLLVLETDQPDSFGQQVRLAVKLDLDGINLDDLVLYRYDALQNYYDPLRDANPWVDDNGYLHLSTSYAGLIVVSDGALSLREAPEALAA